MKVLVDTNVLARMVQPEHIQQPVSLTAVESLRKRGDELYIVPQVLYEFWVLCTRPIEQNGFGLTAATAIERHQQAKALFSFAPESEAIFPIWESLVRTHGVRGKNAHNARLVAAMKAHAIPAMLTFNMSDFTRFVATSDITLIDPANVSVLITR